MKKVITQAVARSGAALTALFLVLFVVVACDDGAQMNLGVNPNAQVTANPDATEQALTVSPSNIGETEKEEHGTVYVQNKSDLTTYVVKFSSGCDYLVVEPLCECKVDLLVGEYRYGVYTNELGRLLQRGKFELTRGATVHISESQEE